MYEEFGKKMSEEDAKTVFASITEALKNNQEAQNYLKIKEEIKQGGNASGHIDRKQGGMDNE